MNLGSSKDTDWLEGAIFQCGGDLKLLDYEFVEDSDFFLVEGEGSCSNADGSSQIHVSSGWTEIEFDRVARSFSMNQVLSEIQQHWAVTYTRSELTGSLFAIDFARNSALGVTEPEHPIVRDAAVLFTLKGGELVPILSIEGDVGIETRSVSSCQDGVRWTGNVWNGNLNGTMIAGEFRNENIQGMHDFFSIHIDRGNAINVSMGNSADTVEVAYSIGLDDCSHLDLVYSDSEHVTIGGSTFQLPTLSIHHSDLGTIPLDWQMQDSDSFPPHFRFGSLSAGSHLEGPIHAGYGFLHCSTIESVLSCQVIRTLEVVSFAESLECEPLVQVDSTWRFSIHSHSRSGWIYWTSNLEDSLREMRGESFEEGVVLGRSRCAFEGWSHQVVDFFEGADYVSGHYESDTNTFLLSIRDSEGGMRLISLPASVTG